jgi:hypothetical protein
VSACCMSASIDRGFTSFTHPPPLPPMTQGKAPALFYSQGSRAQCKATAASARLREISPRHNLSGPRHSSQAPRILGLSLQVL